MIKKNFFFYRIKYMFKRGKRNLNYTANLVIITNVINSHNNVFDTLNKNYSIENLLLILICS